MRMGVSKLDIRVKIEAPSPLYTKNKIAATAKKILGVLGWKKAALSVLVVGDRRIRRLNLTYLHHDRATDVIAFSQLEGRKLKSPPHHLPVLGDIVISRDTTTRQAVQFGNSFWYEFVFYLCHGILHLMGYEDRKPSDQKKMWKKQKSILKKININIKGEKVEGEG